MPGSEPRISSRSRNGEVRCANSTEIGPSGAAWLLGDVGDIGRSGPPDTSPPGTAPHRSRHPPATNAATDYHGRATAHGVLAAKLLSYINPAEITHSQAVLARSQSVGQQRMRELHASFRVNGSARDLEIYLNLCAGVGFVRGGACTALVGSHQQVTERIEEYASLGIEEFILSGYPHLEQVYWAPVPKA